MATRSRSNAGGNLNLKAAKAAPEAAGYSGTQLGKKLGVTDGQLTWRLRMPASVAREIARGGVEPKLVKAPRAGLAMAHLFVTQKRELAEYLKRLREVLAQDGAVWVSWPKRTTAKNVAKIQTDIAEDAVREAALPLGFVDIKVCAVDAIWSGLKLVIRKGERKKVARAYRTLKL